MKIFGDVTDTEKSAAAEIEEMENILNSNKRKLSSSRMAKGYVCLVYEWYRIGMEEEGNRLLLKIEQVSPNYFQRHLHKHMAEDKTYEDLIKNLFVQFVFLLTNKPQQFIPVFTAIRAP